MSRTSPETRDHRSRLCGIHLATLFLLAAIFVSGCGDSGPKKHRVRGSVTWEDQPLAQGDILFIPIDGGVPDAGKITGGQFDMQATAGEKQVSIVATREVGPVDPSMGMARRESYIPARYNDETKLTATVEPGGANKFDFALTAEE